MKRGNESEGESLLISIHGKPANSAVVANGRDLSIFCKAQAYNTESMCANYLRLYGEKGAERRIRRFRPA